MAKPILLITLKDNLELVRANKSLAREKIADYHVLCIVGDKPGLTVFNCKKMTNIKFGELKRIVLKSIK